MFKHILIPIDGTEFSERAVDAGVQFAKSINASITGFIAEPEFRIPTQRVVASRSAPISTAEHSERARRHAEGVLGRIEERARSAGVQFASDFVENNDPVDAIVQAAEKHQCDLIMMASHCRRGIDRLLHRNAATGVLSHTRVPVLVLH